MSNLIPNSFIQDLVARIDIVELIQSSGIALKKTGQNYSACCPFHAEKSPSFTVSPTKQFYHCFGCGANGNAIGFLMEHERLEFVDAVESLAKHIGVTVPRDHATPQSDQRAQHQPIYDILKDASLFYQNQLRQHPQAIAYLKNRGLTGQIAKTYALGYAPPGWDHAIKHLGHPELLIQAGLAKTKNDGQESDKRVYDSFRDRIMFPIRDARGRVIGFGGRILNAKDPKNPKYLNSPETPVFHKGQEVYGLHEILQARKKVETFLIVEGYMDVIALAQHGITNAVATLGTAISQQALERLFRRVDTLIFCFDGDNAGQTAAWRALEICLPLMQDGREARFVFLPQEDDPDSLVRKLGQDGFRTYLEQALPLSEFLFKKLLEEYPAESADSRAKLAHAAQPLLDKIPDGIFKNLLNERLNKLIGQTVMAPVPQTPQRFTKQAATRIPKLSPVRHAITLLINCPALAHNATIDLTTLQNLEQPGLALLVELFNMIQENPTLSTASLLEHWRSRPEFDALSRLVREHFESGSPEQAQEFRDTLKHIQKAAHEEKLETLLAKSGRGTISDEERILLQKLIQQSKL